jgi:16S rRNA (guanine527-N7)-methyltransferase
VEPAKIAAILQPYADVPEKLINGISIYIDILGKWNSKISLTAVRDPQEMVSRHFGESFFLAETLIGSGWRGTVADVGSGAGFPGVPLAMYSPTAVVTLIESQGKKATFLNEVLYALKLNNAKVFRGRAEQFPGHVDLVILRAVEEFEKVLPIALDLVKFGGRAGLMVGRDQIKKAKLLSSELEWKQPVKVPGAESRVLLIGTKIVNDEPIPYVG